MTREEAIQILSTRDRYGVPCGYTSGYQEALDMAIQALTAEPKTGGEIGRREHDDIVVEGINIYCPNCGYKTTIIGTVNKPERSR